MRILFLIAAFMPLFGHLHAHSRMAPPTPEEQIALDSMNEKTSIGDLLKHISSHSYHVGRAAASLLINRKDEGAVAGLIEIITGPLTGENKYAAYNALLGLSAFDTDAANGIFKEHALTVVGHFSNELVLTEGERDEQRRIREAYCRTLTRGLKPEQQAEALAGKIEQTLWVLEPLIDLGAAAIPTLTKIVEDEVSSPSTRVHALRGLSKLKSPSVVPLLRRVLNAEDNDPLFSNSSQLLGEAAAAMVTIQGKEGLKEVQKSFQERKAWLGRLYMMRSMGEAMNPDAQAWLEEIATNENWTKDTEAPRRIENRIEAIRNHALLGAKQIQVNVSKDKTATLIQLLEHEHDWVRAFAAEQLLGVQDKRIVEPAIAHLDDKDSRVRRYLIEALGLVGDKRAAEPLMKILTQTEMEDRVPAKRALEGLGYIVVYAFNQFHALDPNDPLMTALLSGDKAQRETSVKELFERGRQGGILLSAMLQDKDGLRRNAAAEVLEVVKSATQSGRPQLVKPAIDVLAGLGEIAISDLIGILRKVQTEDLRAHAAEALALSGRGSVMHITAAINQEENVKAPWMPHLFVALARTGRTGRFILRQHAKGKEKVFAEYARKALEMVPEEDEP
ncbi:MAG: HEAT repeat domain-containing protein [Planctomycetota bacterium]|nr:HEAT repeat domain-containing protein [Planctomycetota bacterium]MDA1141505.1 HEAT repeat domain-containing protein [Planctomycetota bacterium]